MLAEVQQGWTRWFPAGDFNSEAATLQQCRNVSVNPSGEPTLDLGKCSRCLEKYCSPLSLSVHGILRALCRAVAHRLDTSDTLRLGATTVPAIVTFFAEDFALPPGQRELLTATYRGLRGEELLVRLGISDIELKELLQAFVLQTGRSVWVAIRELEALRPAQRISTVVPAPGISMAPKKVS